MTLDRKHSKNTGFNSIPTKTMAKKSIYTSKSKISTSTKSTDPTHSFEVSSLIVKEKIGTKSYDDMTDTQYLSLMKEAEELFKRPLDPSKRVD